MSEDLSLVNVRLLPPQIRLIANAIGLPETLALLQARGGGWLLVPQNADKCQVLKGIISSASIAQLVKAFGGKRLDMPQADKVLSQLRNIVIREMRKTKTDTEIGRQFNLSRRHIINIGNNIPEPNPTLDLFPLDISADLFDGK